MAIEGLRPASQHSNLHIGDEVGAWLGVMDRLGLMQDHDRVAETMIADIDNLRLCGLVGKRLCLLSSGHNLSWFSRCLRQR